MTNAVTRLWNSIGGSILVRSGRVGILGTTGARTGLPRQAHIGFVARPDGSLLIGAGTPSGHAWTSNAKANPSVTFSVKGVERRYRARLLTAGERDAALAEIRAKMGGPAARANWGDLFVLEPEA